MLKAVVDFDNCLVGWMHAFREFHNHHYGTTLAPEDVHDYDPGISFGVTRDEMTRRMREFNTGSEFFTIGPLRGSVVAMKELSRYYDLVLVTGRPKYIHDRTTDQVKEFFPSIKQIVYAYGGEADPAAQRGMPSKAEVCQRLGADWMLEDSLEHIRPCADFVPRLFLQMHPWNLLGEAYKANMERLGLACDPSRLQGTLPGNVHRVYSPQDIVKSVVHQPRKW